MTSEEIIRLLNQIETACHGKQPGEVINALWAILLSAIMALEGYSASEAVECVRGFCDEVMARHRH